MALAHQARDAYEKTKAEAKSLKKWEACLRIRALKYDAVPLGQEGTQSHRTLMAPHRHPEEPIRPKRHTIATEKLRRALKRCKQRKGAVGEAQRAKRPNKTRARLKGR